MSSERHPDHGVEEEGLEPEYDFSGAERGKYYQRYREGADEAKNGETLGLGTRIARRFDSLGLTEEIPELRREK